LRFNHKMIWLTVSPIQPVDAIERTAPAEANNLQKEFSPKDVHFG